MILKRWPVIIGLSCIGIALVAYWLSLPKTPDGVTAQSGSDDAVKTIAALAGAITSLGGAIFGILGQLNDYRAKRIAIATAEVELAQKRKELESE